MSPDAAPDHLAIGDVARDVPYAGIVRVNGPPPQRGHRKAPPPQQPDERIVVAGYSDGGFAVARYLTR